MKNGFNWYAVKTQSRHELDAMICIEGIRDRKFCDDICDVAVATASGVLHTGRHGKGKKPEMLWPGYIFVEMRYSYDVAEAIKNIGYVRCFVGNGATPEAMTYEEIKDAGLELRSDSFSKDAICSAGGRGERRGGAKGDGKPYAEILFEALRDGEDEDACGEMKKAS